MLGDEEGDAAFSQASGVFLHHVISHDLHVTAIALQEEVAHQVSLRGEGDAMVSGRVEGEIFLQHLVELTSGAIER